MPAGAGLDASHSAVARNTRSSSSISSSSSSSCVPGSMVHTLLSTPVSCITTTMSQSAYCARRMLCVLQVYTSVPTAHSRQVLQLQQNPQDGAWAANTNLPALTVGLIGHSAAVYKSKVYVFGGQGLVPPQKDALSGETRRLPRCR
jgi:hypothetical protein